MSQPVVNSFSDTILVPLRLLLRDFAAFAGAKVLKAFLFVFLGAVLSELMRVARRMTTMLRA